MGGSVSESLPEERAPGMVEELLYCWDREGQRGHASFLLLCWGRREGWRNNLDGLGLIKEKERNRQKKKKKNGTHRKIKSSGLGCLR